jgi:hypothetical protein
VEEAAAVGIHLETKLGNQIPEVVRQRGRGVARALLGKLFLKTKPVTEGGGRPCAESIAPDGPKRFEPIDLRYFFFFSGVGVKVTAGW